MKPLEIIRADVPDGTQEPVFLQEVKEYLSIDYDDWDTLLTELITASREQVEQTTSLNLIEREVTIKNNRAKNRVYPIGEFVSEAVDIEAEGNENYTYTAGKVCNAALKNCIKQRVATGFKYRENGSDIAISMAVNASVYTEFAYRYDAIL